MDSEARVSINVTWSAPDVDLSDGKLLAEVRASIANAPGVSAVAIFLISEHQVVVRIESQVDQNHLVEELSSAFGPRFELQLVAEQPGDRPRLVVVPRSDKQQSAPAPAADSEPNDANQPASSASRPTTMLLDGIESVYKKFRLATENQEKVIEQRWTRRTTALALVLALVVWFMLPPVFNFKAVPWGVDQWGHLTRLELLRASVAADFLIRTGKRSD